MFVGGVGLPFNPSLYRPIRDWPKIHSWTMGDAPGPRTEFYESEETLQQQADRVRDAGIILRHQIKLWRPDALLILASDRGRLFSSVQIPQLWIYTGREEIWGSTRLAELDEPADEEIIRLQTAPDLANFI